MIISPLLMGAGEWKEKKTESFHLAFLGRLDLLCDADCRPFSLLQALDQFDILQHIPLRQKTASTDAPSLTSCSCLGDKISSNEALQGP